MKQVASNKSPNHIAFTGHKGVILKDKNIFIKRLTCKIDKLRLTPSSPITMYNAMAEGADQWAIQYYFTSRYIFDIYINS